MKAKVINKFIDKYTQELHDVGEVLTITQERLDEILKVGQLVEVIEERQGKPAAPASTRRKKTKAEEG